MLKIENRYFIFWFPWTFFLLRSRGANEKIWYDIIVKNAFLSSHKNVLLQCFSCKVKVFVKLQKKRTDLERIKILPLLSVWNVIIPFPLFCSGENLEPGIVTLNFLLFTFLSGFHPILDALLTSKWIKKTGIWKEKWRENCVCVRICSEL